MDWTSFVFVACGLIYSGLTGAIVLRARSQVLLAFSCATTAIWAAVAAGHGTNTLVGPIGTLDFARSLSWYVYLLALFRKLVADGATQMRAFAVVAIIGAAFGFTGLLPGAVDGPQFLSITSFPVASRLLIAVCELLLIENLYLNLPDRARWHVAIPSVVLGMLACLDILVIAETVLYHQRSDALEGARAVVMAVCAPLLYAAAVRGERWTRPVRLSRKLVFHSTTLVLSGSVLLCLAITGEVLRQVTPAWGWTAELSLLFAGLVGIALFLMSGSGRSLLYRRIVHHFFADEYDYRRQWLSCIDTLSGTGSIERTALQTRAIRAIADAIDSPAGALFLRDDASAAMQWAGSWNMPATTTGLAPDHRLVVAMQQSEAVVDVATVLGDHSPAAPLDRLGRVWLAVPLLHNAGMIGAVLVAPPRVSFRPNQEVFGILRILGREVATYINEQKATEAMLQTRDLRDYSKRFAFVAHDIKNVSSQLAMLLQNAEHHISNPDFQHDMLTTVRASVQKIAVLLKRLEEPEAPSTPASLAPTSRLETLLATYKRATKANILLEHDGSTGRVMMNPDSFDMAVTHLLNNAVEASAGKLVLVKLRHEATRVTVAIIDRGPGMSPDFVRDHLFAPFETRKQDGSGIGAFQARELLREAGAELDVRSEVDVGTTMTVTFARADRAAAAATAPALVTAEGHDGR